LRIEIAVPIEVVPFFKQLFSFFKCIPTGSEHIGKEYRRGSFQSVRELIRSIEVYLAARNKDPKPYKWKAEGEEILAKVKRARDALATVS